MNGFTNFVNHSNKPTQEGEKMWEGTTEKGWKRNGGGGGKAREVLVYKRE